MGLSARSPVVSYGGAVAVVVMAAVIRWLLAPWLDEHVPFATFFGAVALATWFGGPRPAVLTAILGYVAAEWLFIEPHGELTLAHARTLVGLVMYLLTCAIIIGFGGAAQRADRRSEDERRGREEEARRRSEFEDEARRLAAIVGATPDFVAVSRLDGRLLYLNQAARRAAEIPDDREVGAYRLSQLCPAWVDERLHREWLPAALRDGSASGEGAILTGSGAEVPASFVLIVHRDASGEPRSVSTIARDISRLRATEEQLRERREEFQTLLDTLPVPVVVAHDAECLQVTGNRAAYEMLRLPAGRDLTTPASSTAVAGVRVRRDGVEIPSEQWPMRRAARGEEVHAAEVEVAFDDGAVHTVQVSAAPLFDEAGRARGAIAISLDVTERKRIERDLRVFEERFRAFMDNSPAWAWLKDEEGRFVFASRSLLTALGRTEATLIGKTDHELFPAPAADSFRAGDLAVLSGEHAAEFTEVAQDLGGVHDILTVKFPVRDARGGRFVGGVAVDVTAQKHAERELAGLVKRLSALVDNTPLAVVEWDADFHITRWSGQSAALFGWTAAEAVGRHIDEFPLIYDPDRPIVEATMGRLLDPANPFVVARNRNNTRDGRVVSCEWYNSVLHDESGRMVAILSLVLDATERQLAEAELRHRVEEVEALMTFLPIAVVRSDDPDCHRLTGNPAAHRLLNIPSNENLSKSPPPGQPPPAYRTLQDGIEVPPERLPMQYACRHGVEVRDAEYEVVFEGGESRYIYCYATPLFEEPGRVRGCVFAAVDISERKRAEAELREAEERFRTMADNIPQLAWMADPDGALFWYNRRWYDYTGTTLEQMRGWGWQSVQDPEELPRVVEKYRAHLASGEPWEDTFPLRRHDGEYRWHLSRAMPVRDDLGRIVRWFGTNTDVTEQRNLEQALKESDRRKDEFLAMLAHELRNPLAPLRNGLEIIRMAGHDRDVIAQARDMMERQLRHFVRLVDDLLDVSRISRDKLTLHRERVELASVVQSAIEACEPLIGQGGQHLSVSLPERAIYVDADPTRLSQALYNLLSNAAKFSERGGRISITATRQGDRVVIAVKDGGVGIPPHMLSRVFDMFTQVDRTLERAQGGLGIGLCIVKRLVELHGGTVEARSAGHGQGSEFLVRLPIVLSLVQGEPGDRHDDPARPADRRRILVVDDNEDAAQSLATILELMGNEVRTAEDGLTGLAVAEAFRPSLIILDIGMPGINGYETCRRLRERPWGGGVVIVALTGWGQDEDKRLSREAGFDRHLVKPVEPDVLEQLLGGLQPTSALGS